MCCVFSFILEVGFTFQLPSGIKIYFNECECYFEYNDYCHLILLLLCQFIMIKLLIKKQQVGTDDFHYTLIISRA